MSYDPTRALEQEIRRLPRIGRAEYLPTVRKHLAKGADPNSDALLGKKSIMVMALDNQFPLSHEQRSGILPLLIGHGGDPLRHTVLLTDMVEGRNSILGDILKAMAKREGLGWPCRGADGGNILHALLVRSPLVRDVGWAIHRNDNTEQPVIKRWVEAFDDQGRTPLHLLWEHLDSDWLAEAWDLTNTMARSGVDIDAEGMRGSVNQAIYKRLGSVDLNLVREEYLELAAELSGWIMLRGTQPAAAGKAPARRF